jgi:hypothetical protein
VAIGLIERVWTQVPSTAVAASVEYGHRASWIAIDQQ